MPSSVPPGKSPSAHLIPVELWDMPALGDRSQAKAAVREVLARIGRQPDDSISLGETALLLSALDRPGVAMRPYLQHLQTLAGEVAAKAAGQSAHARAEILSAVIADEYGYGGDHLTYDDLANASLAAVVDRRQGLPVTLGILYMHTARAQAWPIHGLGVPGHFVIRLEEEESTGRGTGGVILDPFNHGRILGAPDLESLLRQLGGSAVQLNSDMIRPVTNRHILLRLQNNLKTRYLAGRQVDRAVDILERMHLLAPDNLEILAELGTCCARAGRLRAAEQALDRCLSLGADIIDAARLAQIKAALDAMKRRIN